jgi:replication factor A3
MSDQISMRVNAGRLASLTGNTVRLPCKVLRVSSSTSATQSTSDHLSLIQLSDDTAIVEASDSGQVEIQRKVRACCTPLTHN